MIKRNEMKLKSGDQVVFLTANSFLMNQNIPRTATDAPCSAEAWSHKGWVIQTWAQKKNQPRRKLTWNTHWWDNSFTTFTWGQQLTGSWPNRKKPEQVSPYPKGWHCRFSTVLEVHAALCFPGQEPEEQLQQSKPSLELHQGLLISLWLWD